MSRSKNAQQCLMTVPVFCSYILYEEIASVIILLFSVYQAGYIKTFVYLHIMVHVLFLKKMGTLGHYMIKKSCKNKGKLMNLEPVY